MTDERIIEYVRSRGQTEVPNDLAEAVMAALDAPLPSRSWFAAWIPAAASAVAVGVVVAVGLLIGRDPNVGTPPASSQPAPSASVGPTIDELRFALLQAVDVLQAAPGVEGRQQAEIAGTIGVVTWFDWRPNGDQVVVQRTDLDVTETGWWLAPDGVPPATGQRIYTYIGAKVGDRHFFTDEDGEWQVVPGDDGYRTGALGLMVLDSALQPWHLIDDHVQSLPDPSDVRIERDDLVDGGVEWVLEYQWLGSPVTQRWAIAPGGELRTWTFEREDRSVDPEGDFNANTTRAWLQFTITDSDPIEPPDVGAAPDPATFGLPEDLPL